MERRVYQYKMSMDITLYISAGSEQVEKAKEMIKKMKFTFNSENFENPSLQKYWRNIEALALDRTAPEEVEDFTCKYPNGV